MNAPPARLGAERSGESAVQIGALVPLARPGWVEAGRPLLAGLELAVGEVNDAGGIGGRPLELVIRDTAADPQRATAAVDELARLGVAALAGEYHSELVSNRATALLLLVGFPEPAVSIVKSVRRDPRLAEILIGAPAGQPEFAEWSRLLGGASVAVPFLRYLPERLSPLGARVETALRERLAEAPSFVAFEGYDTVAVLARMLRSHGSARARIADSWPHVAVEGTRGQIQFSRQPGIGVWQWAWPPTQVVDRDPAKPDRFRVLHDT